MLTNFLLIPALYFVVADVDRLVVRTEPAVAAITPYPGGRRLLRLPDLEFPLAISVRCGQHREPESLSISIADTGVRIGPDDLRELPVLNTSLKVSARQIAPIAIQGFCAADAVTVQPILVPTALTAQVSLRCVDDDEQTIVFAAEALDVLLNCDSGGR